MRVHPRLMWRNGVAYHRATVPVDLRDSYPKTEETWSLRTRDPSEAVRLVRVASVEADRRFDEHRVRMASASKPLADLTGAQLHHIREAYFQHLLEEDENTRLAGFHEGPRPTVLITDPAATNETIAAVGFRRPSFEDASEANDWLLEATKAAYARGEQDAFFKEEAKEVLS